MSSFELGGFAESPEVVSDALTEEERQRDFECFNYCLTEDYAHGGVVLTQKYDEWL